ncbi:MAG: pilin [Alcaligenaceae bacterium]|nr:MAG: pilin [Alcaligenaceae bacterium]
MRIKIKEGFTLIELMITVAIVGVLAAVALPAYQDYTIRAQFTEGINLADGHKIRIVEEYAQTGSILSLSGAAALATSQTGKYVHSATINTGGNIVVRFGNSANAYVRGYGISILPIEQDNGQLKWQCKGPGIPQKYMPKSFCETS